MASPKLVVAVCGGGIGGLTTAIAIARLTTERKDIHVDLYEAVKEFTEVGAGVGMFRRPWSIMKALGIDKSLRKLDNIPEEGDPPGYVMQLHKSDQPKGLLFYEIGVNPGLLRFHRAVFQRCLAEQLDPEIVTSHFSKRLISYSSSSPGSPVTLNFADGSTATCDVLVGADGIRSATRRSMLERAALDAVAEGSTQSLKRAAQLRMSIEPVWSGSIAYRALVPFERLIAINPDHGVLSTLQIYMGKCRHIVAYPISHAKVINFVGFCTVPEKEGTVYEGKIMEERTRAELLEYFVGWDDEVQQLVQCVEKPSRWAIQTVRPLPLYAYDRVALLGDAAHAMLPHQGSGAGQAIEDAYILASLLADDNTDKDTLATALSVYDQIRRPRGTDVQRFSRNGRQIYDFLTPTFTDIDLDHLYSLGGAQLKEHGETDDYAVKKLWEMGAMVATQWEWAWTTDSEEDRKDALKIFEGKVREADAFRNALLSKVD